MEKLIVIIITVLIIGLYFIAMFDIFRTKFESNTIKTLWVLFVLFLPILGPTIYYYLKKS